MTKELWGAIAALVGVVVATVALTTYVYKLESRVAALEQRFDEELGRIGEEQAVSYEAMPPGSLVMQGPDGCPGDWVSVALTAGDGSIILPCRKPRRE